MITIFLFYGSGNLLSVEVVDKIKDESKDIFRTLTRTSLEKEDVIKFLSEYVILIDDDRGDGVVAYYFENNIYKRYKNLELLSEDKWRISKLDSLNIFNKNKKETWKIQPSKKNTINIKRKLNLIGKLYDFSYEWKTDYYLKLEQKKLNMTK